MEYSQLRTEFNLACGDPELIAEFLASGSITRAELSRALEELESREVDSSSAAPMRLAIAALRTVLAAG